MMRCEAMTPCECTAQKHKKISAGSAEAPNGTFVVVKLVYLAARERQTLSILSNTNTHRDKFMRRCCVSICTFVPVKQVK
jgi:hypothetical protein